MTTLTKQQAQELGMVAYTNRFGRSEEQKALFNKMWPEIKANHPGATVVVCEYGYRQIWLPAKKPALRPDNPRALRGKYPAPCSVVGGGL